MFTVFGKGRCPICGEIGMAKTKKVFFCRKCNITFSEFGFSGTPSLEDREVELT